MQYSIINFSSMLTLHSPHSFFLITRSFYPLICFIHFAHPQTPTSGNHHKCQSLLCSYNFCFCFCSVQIPHMSSYDICSSLTYFTQHNALKAHPCCHNLHYYLLYHNNIPLYIYFIFFIHSSINRYLGGFLEKAMAPHSSTLAWKIPWMEEPGRLQSMGS